MTQDVGARPTLPRRERTVVDRGARPSLVRNVLSNWGVLATAIVYTLVITPTVVRALNQESYGVWSFLNAFAAYSNLFYLGLGSALLRFGAEHHAAGRRSEFNRLVSVILTIYSTLAALSLVLGLLASPFMPRLLAVSDSTSVSATVIILAARIGLLFVGSAFAGVLVAQGRTDLYGLVGICGHVARLLIVPFAVRASDPLSALALTVTLTGAAEVIAMARLAFRIDSGLKIIRVIPTAAELRTLYGFGTSAFLLQLADRLISYSDTVIIGLLLGPSYVALYVLPLQLAEYGRMVIRGIVSVMLPHLSALLATEQRARFARSYFRTLRTTGLVGAFVSVNLVALGPMFLRLWVGPDLAAEALPLLVCLALACFAQAIAVDGQTPFFLALRKAGPAAAVLLIEAGANLGLSLALARRLGIVGVALATAVPAVLVSGTALTVRGARAVGVPLLEVVSRAILPASGFALTLAAVHVGIVLIMPPASESYALFLTKLTLSMAVGAAIGWLFIPHSDRRSIRVSLAHAIVKGRRLAGRFWSEDPGLTLPQ